MNTIYKAKGILLREYIRMGGTTATEPFKPFQTDSKEALLDHVNSLMVDNIRACGLIITRVSKIENEDEMFINKSENFQCVGTVTDSECEKLRELCKQI